MNLKLLFLLAASTFGRLTMAERRELKDQADKADKEIYFLKFHEIEAALAAQRTTLLFLGASWCHNTQRFTPKYLQVQKWVEDEKLYEQGFRMAKVECSVDREKFCVEEFKIDGFPTVLVFVDGKRLHEYPYADEADPVYHYIKKLIADFPPDPSRTYPKWIDDKTSKKPAGLGESNKEETMEIAHEEKHIHEQAQDDISVPIQEYTTNQESSMYLLLAGLIVVSVVGLILFKWRRQSQYSKVSSLSD